MPTMSQPLNDASPDTSCVAPLCEALSQLRELISQLDPQHYTMQPVTTYGGSIGGHTRHCLDHVDALLQGVDGGVVDYENRQRGCDAETCRDTAVQELDRLHGALIKIDGQDGHLPVTASVLLTPNSPAMHAPSSLAREVAFVLNHTIHHQAMIGGMAKALGGQVTDNFGVAPGTLRHREQAEA